MFIYYEACSHSETFFIINYCDIYKVTNKRIDEDGKEALLKIDWYISSF